MITQEESFRPSKWVLVFSLLVMLVISTKSFSTICVKLHANRDNASEIDTVGSNSIVPELDTIAGQGEVLFLVSEMPDFVFNDKHGCNAFINYVVSNMQYPESETAEGKVYASFVVEIDGHISTIKIVRSLGKPFDDEVVRAIAHAPKWIPGKQNGIPVRIGYTLPFTFKRNSTEPAKQEEVSSFVEEMPSFNYKNGSGIESFRIYIQDNLRTPIIVEGDHIKGKVFVSFTIEVDGSVSSAKIIKGAAKQIEDEAVRAVLNSPKWNPGKQNGKPVRVAISIPITFN